MHERLMRHSKVDKTVVFISLFSINCDKVIYLNQEIGIFFE